jgi:hypothetical protein
MHIALPVIPHHCLIVQSGIRIWLNVDIQHAVNLQLKPAKQSQFSPELV